jgi:nucleoside-diphosphate-sugar epimerase
VTYGLPVARVLVTGGTGYVAGWCITQLLEEGHDVVATVRSANREHDVRAAIESQTDATTSRLHCAVVDLKTDTGWDDALSDCQYVLHVASPLSDSGNDDEIVAVARDGTLRVLAAAGRAGVERVVVTSSCAAATPHSSQLTGVVDESLWTDTDEVGLSPYRRSKTLAERAAWDYAEDHTLSLATVLPAAVFGPARSPSSLSSLQVIGALLDGSAIAIPRLGFEVVDVRDVAAAHLLAMTTPDADGKRLIVSGELLWFGDIADVLRDRLGDDASRVPTAALTDDEFRSIAAVSPSLKTLLPLIGRELRHSAEQAHRVLGWQPRPAVETIVDSARCLLAFGAAK